MDLVTRFWKTVLVLVLRLSLLWF